MPATITHLVFDGVADGPVGVGPRHRGDGGARRARAGSSRFPKAASAPRQRIVSVDGGPVRTAAERTLAVDGALACAAWARATCWCCRGSAMATAPEIAAALERPDIVRGVELVARAAAKGVLVAASCSATFVLAAARRARRPAGDDDLVAGPDVRAALPARDLARRIGWWSSRTASSPPAPRSRTPTSCSPSWPAR